LRTGPSAYESIPSGLVVAAEGNVLCEHVRIIERSHDKPPRTIYDWRHYLAVIQRKRGAFRNGAPFLELPLAFRKLQDQMLRCPGGDREMADILALVLHHDEQVVLRAVELALDAGVATKTHVLNLLHRLVNGKPTDGPIVDTPHALALAREPTANVERYDGLRVRIVGGAMRHDPASVAVVIMLRSLKMYGMAQAVMDLIEQGAPAFDAAVPILSQLLKAEMADREVRSIAYHMKAARFPAYRDLNGFDFSSSEINEALVQQLHRCDFPMTPTISFWSEALAQAKHTSRPLSASRLSSIIAERSASSRRSNWSTLLSRRRPKARQARSPRRWFASIC
jgi:hypothetical protein